MALRGFLTPSVMTCNKWDNARMCSTQCSKFGLAHVINTGWGSACFASVVGHEITPLLPRLEGHTKNPDRVTYVSILNPGNA
ncbi:hypothetical protein F441_13446 [Phytophthora nicotianae CJ01A1]|uniref:Uncharacterized protein n=1 Tax=Phytophthora nicotianae CJ01A1 TaxID=1317063 RepID=W2WKC6_PHYNI|nr:hypothetical protein F441_13446 [Phytophthora nicotianae CJ01A1]